MQSTLTREMPKLALSDSFKYLMGLRRLEIFLLLKCRDRLHSSESAVYRRQILTSKVDPRSVRVNPFNTIDQWAHIPSGRHYVNGPV